MAEPTATNPQTGERIVFRGGSWVPLDSAAPVASPQAPGIIRGRPDPQAAFRDEDQQFQRNAEVRAQTDQSLQIEAARRAAEADARAARSEQRAVVAETRGTESERTAGYLSGRIVDAVGRLAPVAKRAPAAQSPEWGAEAVRGIAGDTAANIVTSEERQQIRAAQMDILDAALTLGTGAAYTKEQLAGYSQSYFPQIGDSPETVSSKRDALRTLLGRAAGKAGVAAPDVEQAIAALEAIPAIEAEIEDETGLEVNVTDDNPATPRMGGPGGGSGGGGGLMDLAKQGVTLGLADEAAGLGGYLSGFLTGEDPQAAYVRERDSARAKVDSAREQYPVLGTGLEILAGGGAARVAAPVGNALGSIVRQGAGLGALGGYGYGEGAQGSVGGALGGAALGGGLGAAFYGAGRGINALATRGTGPAPTAKQISLIQAGERQGVPVRQPDVRPDLRNRMANAETTQTGGPIIREARANDANLIEQRVGEIGGTGNPSDPFALGNQVQDAGRRYRARTGAQANRLYDTARQEAAGATVQPTEALAAIDQNLSELRAIGENTNGPQIAYLESLREDLSKPLTIEAVQGLRTNMRGQLSGQGLTGTDAERRVAQVIDAANQDLVRELPQNASDALRAADDFYRERQTFINETLSQLMGTRGNPLPAETAASRLVSMTKGTGNYKRFSAMWQELDPTERSDVAATVAESLGRKRNGEFSISTLVQSLDPSKGINPRTSRLIFGDDGAQALSDLRALSKAKTDVQQSLNNSRTGTAVNEAAGGLKNLLLGGLGFSTGGIGGAVAVPVAGRIIANMGEKRAAKMLLNPDFTKWLRNAPNSNNPRVIDRYFSRLAGIGSIPSNDNQAFVSAVRGAFSQSPAGKVAAEEENQNVRREPVR